MNLLQRAFGLALCAALAIGGAMAQTSEKPFEPSPFQPGKDVVWVPSPTEMVDTMLDMAGVTPQDYVVDLGSGDGRNVIAAAKRGASALGVEYNPDMVELSRRAAAAAGVAATATFVQGDMFEADISAATVLPLFLIPANLIRLAPKFLDLKPGTRIVSNSYEIEGWPADEVKTIGPVCTIWCTAYMYIVPAKVAGTWRLPQGELSLEQSYQFMTGTLSAANRSSPVTLGRLRGDQIYFSVDGGHYFGRVQGDTIVGDAAKSTVGAWSANRVR